ncbi:glycosyltransferase [Leifsonia xyli subsp. cynodontis DSM 46306]|uniref:D-inositol 3-phosphate glycosyltransferase n=1 Tax=Leifsonia xyli subsp. cynodontis DSM 46306 TaxID=1389489 RepID=U3PB29_LEIXC|nr:glycosyltransferase [Leifsonia xyli]AGW40718.1 glycosyltransferase [Leifsonia xyli subsp. cynodontis DSM 46306]
MRILFVHEVNYLDKVIYEMHEFPELLALRGHDVSFFHYPEAPVTPSRSLKTTRRRIPGRAYPDAEIELITPPTFGGRPVERYAAPLLNLPGLRREITTGRYDVVVLYAVPTTGWQAVSIAKRAGVPVVFRALDVSHQIRTSPVSPLIRRAERHIYATADLISANNPAMAEYCVDLAGRTGPVSVDLPPVDLSHFADAKPDVRETLGLEANDKVIVYMGSFFGFSGLDIVLEKAAAHLRENPRLKLLYIGGGELDGELRRRTVELGLPSQVIFTGVIPYADLPGYLAAGDVAINPFRPQLLTDVALPHKVLQYMAAGVPAVSTSLRGLRGVVGDTAGVTWAEGPADVVERAISVAALPAEERAAIGARQREFVMTAFSKESAAIGFERTLESVR